jgi:putative pyruvate formate lyase activating enzyme
VSSAHPHFGEERPLSGRRGSGTVFLSSCNLRCVFCQNWSTSHLMEGEPVSDEQLGQLMLDLQSAGCHNINFVSPSHVVPQILGALVYAIPRGLRVPLVYNTGGYDLVSTLRLLEGVVDIYMPDIKFLAHEASERYLSAPNYPTVVKAALKEMHRQVGDLELDKDGVAVRGLLVRHLVMPGTACDVEAIAGFLAQEVSENTYLNLMDQYRPCGEAYRFAEIARRPTGEEFRRALAACRRQKLTRLDSDVGARFRLEW